MAPPSPYVPDAHAIERFRAEGILITPPLFDHATLALVRTEIERAWAARNEEIARSAARGAASKAAYSRARPELPRLHLERPALSTFCRHPNLVRVAQALIGDDVDLVWNQAYAKAAGSDYRTEIPWHQDGWYAEVEGTTYNCWVAITRATVANGALLRAPKPAGDALLPHVWDDRLLFFRCEVDEATATPVELEPGQAFLFTGRVPHRSGVNVTDEGRVSYAISFGSASVRLRANGEAFGDRVAVLREGRLVADVMAEYVARPDDAPLGARIVAEIRERAPRRGADIDRALLALRSAADADASEEALGRLLAILPDSEEALGDLLRARARVDQLLDELASVRGTDARVERLLAERVLELAPEHDGARATLARLDAR